MGKDFFDDPEDVLFNPEKIVLKPKPEQVAETVFEETTTQPIIKRAFDADDVGSFGRALLGPIGTLGEYYFPSELIGGCCPRIAGEEQDIVWNAAAEASDTERVHLVWQAKGDKIWYLAVRSSELSSHPNTWCPFASLLPGMKDALTPPVCYTYYTDESATMMTITADGLQIHRGTASVVRAKSERTARALGDAPVIELVPDRIEKLSPTPWFSLSLFEDRSRRVLAAVATASAIVFAGIALVIWFVAAMSLVSARINMSEIQKRTQEKSLQLVQLAQGLRASPMREQLAKFADVNDGLLAIDGLLDIYRIKERQTLWRAVIPPNVTSDRITSIGGKMLDNSPRGVIIGNASDALTMGEKGN